MKNIHRFAVIASLCLLLSGFASAQTVYRVVKIPLASPNAPIAINNSGQVIVNSGTSGSYQVSIWTRLGGAQSIALTGNNNGGEDINASGSIVGAGDPPQSSNLQAFLAHTGTGVQWLGTLGGPLSAGMGLNNQGDVVGLSYTAASKQHAFLWTSATGMQDLTPSLTSLGGAVATAINSSSQVVGYYFPNGSNNTLGFTWSQAGGMQNIGAAGTLVFAVNDSGTVVGQTPNSQGAPHAFSWTSSGGIKDLGTLGGSQSSALAINSLGWIVGNTMTNAGDGLLHGFLWTPSGGMKDFITLAGFPAKQQTYAAQVNDYGVIAVSTNHAAYLLVPKMTVTVKSSSNPSSVGQSVTFTATVTSIAGAPPNGEVVKFATAGVALGSATIQGGIAQVTTSALSSGSHVITATYAGDANYLSAKGTFTQTVH